MKNTEVLEKVRIDKWLWAARFFKTRGLASAAVNGGKVHYNGHRCKPARAVTVGDTLEIHRGVDKYVIVVDGIADRRGSATIAQTLYTETPESIKDREDAAATRKAEFASRPHTTHRPERRDRGKIRQFLGKD